MTGLTRLPLFAAPDLDRENEWAGYLTVENVAHVAEAVRRVLGGQRFSIATVYEAYNYRPELLTGAHIYPAGRTSERDGVAGLVRAELDCEVPR